VKILATNKDRVDLKDGIERKVATWLESRELISHAISGWKWH
jgi:hypothetical protein